MIVTIMSIIVIIIIMSIIVVVTIMSIIVVVIIIKMVMMIIVMFNCVMVMVMIMMIITIILMQDGDCSRARVRLPRGRRRDPTGCGLGVRGRAAPGDTPPAPSRAHKKSFPRGAPMQHLAPRWNPECSNGHFNTLD